MVFMLKKISHRGNLSFFHIYVSNSLHPKLWLIKANGKTGVINWDFRDSANSLV